MAKKCVLFDFDNTLAATQSIQDIREAGDYHLLNEETMAKVRLYKPIAKILHKLESQGVLMGVVTNSGRRYIEKVFSHLKLDGVFDVVVTHSDVKAAGAKPSPAGIKLALSKLGVPASSDVLYVGDHYTDIIAAYHAGVTPVVPSWGSRSAVSLAPAIEMSSEFFMDYFDAPTEYRLFAERCADLQSAIFPRKRVYFLPLDGAGNVVTMDDEMTTFCLGRYFSQKSAITAALHDHHALSLEIVKKETQNPLVIPEYWFDMFAHVVKTAGDYLYSDGSDFDIVTVIPAKQGKDPRLERLLAGVSSKLPDSHIEFLPDIFYFVEDAQSQKHLQRNERHLEANRALQLRTGNLQRLAGKKVLVIDDIITTGATLERAKELLVENGVESAIGLAVAKTVSIAEHEKTCVVCNRAMRLRKNSNTGERFWGCTGYREEISPCDHTEPFYKKTCPACGRAMALIKNRQGTKFWGCTGYRETPQCSFTQNWNPDELPN